MVLSTGEIGLADKVAEAGGRATAGQGVRLLDIPADGEVFGAFTALHGEPSAAAFADALRRAAARDHGHAGPAFVTALVADMEGAKDKARALMAGFRLRAASIWPDLAEADGQVIRALGRLALIAAAGELGASWGVADWSSGAAMEAALTVFGLWVGARGGLGASEAQEAIARVRAFVVAHGASRFQSMTAAEPIRDRAGWRDADCFWIAKDMWAEIHAGADPARAALLLRAAGYLEPGDGRNLARRLPRDVPGRPRAFAVRVAILGAE